MSKIQIENPNTTDLKISWLTGKGTPNVETITMLPTGEFQEETIDVPIVAEAQVELVTIPVAAEVQSETLTFDVTGAFQEETITIPVAAEKQSETITLPVAAEAQVETLTIPATAAATQADYVMLYNVSGNSAAVWLDIDGAGTEPTGAKYLAADFKIEVNIAVGNSAIVNAAIVKATIELEESFTGFTITDNGDGTLTFTQASKGDCADADPENADDSGAGSIGVAVVNDGVDGALQGDYIVISNAAGDMAAVWLDIDADGTAPSGAKYTAADYQIEVNIASGDSAADNAAALKLAVDAVVAFTGVSLTDNLDGTITYDQTAYGMCADADPENADDSGAGSILAATVNDGVDGALQADYVLLKNTDGEVAAVWLDIDADGTAPTGAKYVAADFQIEVNINSGDSAATNAAAFKAAVDLVTDFNDVTLTDNLDGTITFTQDVSGACADADPENADDTGAGSIGVAIVTNGTTGHLQGDYVLLSNVAGDTMAAWLNIDSNGTAPTGAKYIGSDYKAIVEISSGGSAIDNAAAFKSAVDAVTGFDDVLLTDNLDGTITYIQTVYGACDNADPENKDDSGVGTIGVAVVNEGVDGIEQADFVVVYNVAGESAAVWFDVDADGTAPTGAKYVNADYQIEANINTGDANTVNATALKNAIEAEVAFTGISLTDNADGTITVTQTTLGACDEADPENSDGTGVGAITASTTNLGLDGIKQADYVMVYNVAGVKVAVWFDVDADGTVPTGAKYVASDYQVEVNVATGDTAATNATAMATALGLEANYTNVTITDNLDGSVTLTQDVTGACLNADPENSDDSGAGSITVTVGNEGVTGHNQGDYVVLTNTNGKTLACWIDVDEDGTEPTGAAYVASDYQEIVSVDSGNSAITNGGVLETAINSSTWSQIAQAVDILDGTVTVTQDTGGVVAAADPHNAGDTGVGTITATTDTAGTAGDVKEIVYIPKAGLKIKQNNTTQVLSMQTLHEDVINGDSLYSFAYTDVILPTSTSLSNLVAQIIAFKNNV